MNPAVLIFALAAAATAQPDAAPVPPPVALNTAPLDCSKGYVALVAAARAEPGSAPVIAPAGVPMQAVSTQAGGILTLYNFTTPANPAHPYVARRRIYPKDGVMTSDMSVCPYGEKTASAALTANFTRLNDAFVLGLSAAPPAH